MVTTLYRTEAFSRLFGELQETNSRTEKELLVAYFLQEFPELKDDFYFIIETLDGKHPIGWTFVPRDTGKMLYCEKTIKEIILSLVDLPDRTVAVCMKAERELGKYGEFIAPIVNRTLKLGIGKSLLSKDDLTPMLAKKYEGKALKSSVVTEKLDGNRCIASFNADIGRWQFTSRSGKPMKVNFNMTGMPTNHVYDGEVMSEAQTQLSETRTYAIRNNKELRVSTQEAQLLFNETSGIINRAGLKSGLVYNIFDITNSDKEYMDRRTILTNIFKERDRTTDLRLLPVLYIGNDIETINALLYKVTETGGEGIMLNDIFAKYKHARTDALLKYKTVKFMDMQVMNIAEGSGKYEGMVGALNCYIKTENGDEIYCDVGSGLSDLQRDLYMQNPSMIIGKIVQVGYHELTQSAFEHGTKRYSLRFPRLIKVREDKKETSEF